MVNLSQADAVADIKTAISGRIQAIANVHSLFVATRWIGAELSTIAGRELAPYSTGGEKRVRIDNCNEHIAWHLPQSFPPARGRHFSPLKEASRVIDHSSLCRTNDDAPSNNMRRLAWAGTELIRKNRKHSSRQRWA